MSKLRYAKLGEIADVNWGDTSVTKASYVPNGYPAFSATGCDGFLPYADFDCEAIVLSAIGARAGKTWFVEGKWSCIKNTIRFWSTSSEANNRYLYWATANEDIWPKRGAAQPFITIGDARQLVIPLPAVEQQRRIAAILDQAETLRTQRRTALDLLDSLSQSLFLDMFGDPVANPKGWQQVPVGAITDCIVPGRDKPKSFSGSVPWITTANLNHLGMTLPTEGNLGLTPSEIEEVRAKVIPVGSVIISCVGDLGITSIAGVPMVINQQLHAFLCGPKIDNVYLMHALPYQKPYMLAKASSTTLPYMNKSVCNSIPINIPPLPLQQTFATRIASIEALKATHRRALAALDALFASLQQRAFTGAL